jgi:hypothetical protein
MSWIKMRNDLWDDPRITRLANLLNEANLRDASVTVPLRLSLGNATPAFVIGLCYRLWSVADQYTTDGRFDGLTLEDIDNKVGFVGFAQSMVEIGWLHQDAQGVGITRFSDHNGQSAKSRAQAADRMRALRIRDSSSVTTASPEKDKSKRKRKTSPPTPQHKAAAEVLIKIGVQKYKPFVNIRVEEILAHWDNLRLQPNIKSISGALVDRLKNGDSPSPLRGEGIIAAVRAGLIATANGVLLHEPLTYNMKTGLYVNGTLVLAVADYQTAEYA